MGCYSTKQTSIRPIVSIPKSTPNSSLRSKIIKEAYLGFDRILKANIEKSQYYSHKETLDLGLDKQKTIGNKNVISTINTNKDPKAYSDQEINRNPSAEELKESEEKSNRENPEQINLSQRSNRGGEEEEKTTNRMHIQGSDQMENNEIPKDHTENEELKENNQINSDRIENEIEPDYQSDGSLEFIDGSNDIHLPLESYRNVTESPEKALIPNDTSQSVEVFDIDEEIKEDSPNDRLDYYDERNNADLFHQELEQHIQIMSSDNEDPRIQNLS